MEKQTIDILTQLGSSSVQSAIQAYIPCMVTESIGYLVIIACVILVSVKVYGKTIKNERMDDTEKGIIRLICIIAVVIAATAIPDNVSGIINPRAYAIHQLLKDIRGGSL